jgi:hypothetical protein
METRELHKKKYAAQMREWNAKLEVMKAQTEQLTLQARLDVKPLVDAMHAKIAAAKLSFEEVTAASDDKWEDFVKSASHAWSDLEAAADRAYDAVKRYTKG